MSIARIATLILFLYLISLGIAYLIRTKKIFLFLGMIWLSLVIFAVLFVVFLIILAIVYAIIKKPEIEERSYSIDRINGKEEMK